MKKIQIILMLIIFSVGTIQTTQAQFFKKLEKQAKKKIKREAEKRAERRVNKRIDKTFDKAEGGIDKTVKGKPKKNKKNEIKLPSKYKFDWKMSMKMESKKGDMVMHYLIKQDATYFGTIMDMKHERQANDMITIMDFEHDYIMILMDVEGNKIKQITDIPNDTSSNNQDYNMESIDTKKILGYLCQGYRVKTEDGTATIYIALNAPVSFNNTLRGQNIPKGISTDMLKKLKNGLMLEMIFVSNKKKKHNMRMICTELKKSKRGINVNDYKSFGF